MKSSITGIDLNYGFAFSLAPDSLAVLLCVRHHEVSILTFE